MVLRLRTCVLLIIFIGLLLYMRGLTNGFVGDDYLQIVQNTKVHSLSNVPLFFSSSTYETAGNSQITGIFYRPVMMSLYAIIYALSNQPFLFHFVQVLLHIGVALLIFFFLRKIFPELGAFLLSLVFLVHPANSEAVLYSANMQDILFVLFGMVALLLAQANVYTSWKKYFILVALLLSLFSKESGILFILILFIYIWLFDRKHLKFILVNEGIIAGIYLFFRYAVAHMYAANTSLAPIATISFTQRLLHIPLIVLYYIKQFLFPLDVRTYQYWTMRTISLTNFWLPLVVDILFAGLVLVGYRWVNKKYKHLYIFFGLWFVIGLLLHIQLIPLDATVADRWFYFPMIGLLGLLGIVIWQIKGWKKASIRSLGVTGAVMVVLLLALRTFIRIGDWQSELTLFGHDITRPSNFIMNNAYGAALIQDGQFTKALPYVKASVQEHPYTANINNLAIIYTSQKNYSKAKEEFQKALQIGQTYSLYENYANFLLYYDSSKEALDFSNRALQVYPESAKLWLVYGESLYLQGGDRQTAMQAIAKSYQIQPNEESLRVFTTMRKNQKLILLID